MLDEKRRKYCAIMFIVSALFMDELGAQLCMAHGGDLISLKIRETGNEWNQLGRFSCLTGLRVCVCVNASWDWL